MAEESIIKVRRHREDERVIYAGASAASDGASEAPASPAAAALLDEVPVATPEAPQEERMPASADSFRETTLDDIESSTMSGLQKGIIVGAVLLIVACIAWYVLFMS